MAVAREDGAALIGDGAVNAPSLPWWRRALLLPRSLLCTTPHAVTLVGFLFGAAAYQPVLELDPWFTVAVKSFMLGCSGATILMSELPRAVEDMGLPLTVAIGCSVLALVWG